MTSPARPRTVLVTGAARRLGRSIALALAAGGWQVAVHYRSSQQDALETVAACAELSRASAHFDADFADEAAVRALLPRVVAHFGSVDAVVNSAALFEHDDAASFSYGLLERHLRSNAGAPVLLAQALHTLSPLGRSSTPEDVASAVLFALHNRSITGTTLLVDGGQHLMKFDRDFSLM